jgi:hypothetical protein
MSNYHITMKLITAGMFILGTPLAILFEAALIFAPIGFWQLITFTILALIMYIPLVIIFWILFWLIIEILGVK